MIPVEKAQDYIGKHPKIDVSRKQLKTFGKPYEILGLMISGQLHHEYGHSVAFGQMYHGQFGSDPQTNPWESKEGKELASALFGQTIGPHAAAMWRLMDRLPYQSGYTKRPFRFANSNYVETKINLLAQIYYAGESGFNNMAIEDQISYSVYQHNNGSALFLAVVLAENPDRYFPLLEELFLGEHEIGGVSRELIQALLLTDLAQYHLLVEKLLLAAQQQEGLRQSILESLDFTSITAFKRFINVILEHNLTRFSSVVRAVDTWFGFGWEAPKSATIKRVLELAGQHLEYPGMAEKSLRSQDNLELYSCLWAKAIVDVDTANLWAFNLIFDDHTDKIKKLVSLFFVTETERTHTQVIEYAEKNMGTDVELDYWLQRNFPDFTLTDALFEKTLQAARSLPPKGQLFEARGFAWKSYAIQPEDFYDKLIQYAETKHLVALANDLNNLPSNTREKLMKQVFPDYFTYGWNYRYGHQNRPDRLDLSEDSWQRQVVRKAILDRNNSVSATAVNVFQSMELYPPDIDILEQLLSRKGKDLRKASIELLLAQPDARLQMSVDRLIESANIDQRLAALEMLSILHENNRLMEMVHNLSARYRTRELSKNEQVFLDKLSPKSTELNFLNGFGVIDYGNLTDFYQPQERFERKKGLSSWFSSGGFLFKELIDIKKTTKAINQLFDLFGQHKDHEYRHEGYQGETVTSLLGNNLTYLRLGYDQMTPVERLDDLPLADLWKQWYQSCGLNDFELYAVVRYCRNEYYAPYLSKELKQFMAAYLPEFPDIQTDKKTYFHQSDTEKIVRIIEHLADAYADKKVWASFRLDVLEDSIRHFPDELKTKKPPQDRYHYGNPHWTTQMTSLLYGIYEYELEELDDEQCLRLWKLQWYLLAQAINKPAEAKSVQDVVPNLAKALDGDQARNLPVPYTGLTLRLYQRQHIAKDDLLLLSLLYHDLFFLLDGGQNYLTQKFSDFQFPEINRKLKENLLRVELERGDLPTEASRYISSMSRIEGLHYFFEVLQRMGNEKFERGYSYDSTSKRFTFSRILKQCTPDEEDTHGDFTARLHASKFPKKRLVEVACYATQWADWLGDYLKIDKLKEAVWWFIAHTTDYMDAEKETVISRYSNIPRNDFQKGAIDIDWFHRVNSRLGKGNWKLVHEAAKYLSDGLGYRRVKLYSSVLLGETKITETLKKIEEKRDKDYVMALGLIPISKANPEADLLKRYNLLQSFLKESKQFGAQRQESERNAVEIGLDNLARNAGFDDRIRFSWAMESKATQRIMEESVVVLDDLQIELAVGEQGKAELRVSKNGKEQKSIPAKYRKDKKIERIKEAKSYLEQQYTRTRQSLEQAMVRQDGFSADELEKIMLHPVVKAMLGKLVLYTPAKERFGFWEQGKLRDAEGTLYEVQSDDVLLIAHPAHLYRSVEWDRYQKLLFGQQVSQPFKQVFRELYVPTADELERSNRSERYQGHQIQPNKAVALLRGRGWTVNYGEGLQKVFHREEYLATLFSMADWFSPSDVEAPTLEYVCFYRLKDSHLVPLSEIDPVIFSEVMRDVDLVVSVAHVGGVDPEASHSTMEMRGVLAQESARLFRLDNVEVKDRHILVQGQLGNYSIHLGSGLVSKNGLQLSIIPVHSQHRGRVFLPFVDDDPKSAEIISKMRLLANDNAIKDPTILAQINR